MSASILSGTKVLIGDKDLKSQLNERGFGTNRGSAQEISLIEAAFLVEEKTMEVSDGKRNLTLEDLVKVGNKIEDNFYAKYVVYADLRKRGLMVKTGLKFGSDFRVYERGATVKSGHSTKLVNVIPEEYSCSFPEIARAIRLSQNVNKAMIYAIVDEEGDVTYYQIDRIRL